MATLIECPLGSSAYPPDLMRLAPQGERRAGRY